MDIIGAIVLNAVFAAIGFLVLFYVVKAAVVAGLAEDRRAQARAQRTSVVRSGGASHLDADGR